MTFWIVLALGAVAFFVLRPAYKQYRFGVELAKLTSIVERIEGTRLYMPIGSGGGFDSLPGGEGVAALLAFERGIEHVQRFPRHEVTKALVKNAIVASSFGRTDRVQAIDRLITILIERNVALPMDDFNRSYG